MLMGSASSALHLLKYIDIEIMADRIKHFSSCGAILGLFYHETPAKHPASQGSARSLILCNMMPSNIFTMISSQSDTPNLVFDPAEVTERERGRFITLTEKNEEQEGGGD